MIIQKIYKIFCSIYSEILSLLENFFLKTNLKKEIRDR